MIQGQNGEDRLESETPKTLQIGAPNKSVGNNRSVGKRFQRYTSLGCTTAHLHHLHYNMVAVPSQAGPSRPRKAEMVSQIKEPREDVDDPRPVLTTTAGTTRPAEPEEGDEDEERMDLKAIESFAK